MVFVAQWSKNWGKVSITNQSHNYTYLRNLKSMMFYAFKPSQNTILFYLNFLSTMGALAQQQNGTHNIVKIDSWNCKGTFYQSKQHKTQQHHNKVIIHQHHIRKVMVCYKVALKVIQTKLVTDDDLDLILKKNDEDDDKVTAKKDHPEHLTSTMDP